jgi:CRISPR-associated protein Csb2
VDALLIRVRFTADVYRGGDWAQPELLPSPARLHAAFVSAAGGGPAADTVDGELVAGLGAQAAVRWLEEHDLLGVLAPRARVTDYAARRHRIRAAVNVDRGEHHREETPFEPFSALDGPVVFAWPPAPEDVQAALSDLAGEITHLGRADSTVVVSVITGSLDEDGLLLPAAGRGAGVELRVPRPGRTAALLAAHRRARARAPHGAGRKSVQAPDEPVDSAGEVATSLVRFVAPRTAGDWPFAEVWRVPGSARWPAWAMRPAYRVATAVAVHRALVAAIGDDVPPFITGRIGTGPLVGGGHLAVQFSGGPGELLLGVPAGVSDADRAALLDALAARPRVRVGRQQVALDLPRIAPAVTFWPDPADRFATSVPLVLDAPGTPRHVPWTLADGVLCSLGYAFRGPLEGAGVSWGTGWAFRRELVALLRERGAKAGAVRVTSSASRFLHRGRDGDLVVAVHAVMELGELAGERRGFLALGRSRHLGGGLLHPLSGGTG